MPVSLNITLGNPEKSDAMLSALNSALTALTGHPPNPETPDFPSPSIRDMWLFQMASLQMRWLFETNPPPVSLNMQASLKFLNCDVGKVDVSVVKVDSPKPESVAQNPAPSKIEHQKTAHQRTIATPMRQLTWQFDVARLADFRVDSSADSQADLPADLPLFLANTRELHCQFNPESGLQVNGWQPFELPKAELAALDVCAALGELAGDSALFPEESKPDSHATNASLFNFEAALFNFEVALFDFEVIVRPRLVRQSASLLSLQAPSKSHPEPNTFTKEKDEGGYVLVFDGVVRIVLNVVDAQSGSESAHLQKKQTNEQALAKHSVKNPGKHSDKHSDKQSTISPDVALIGEVSILDVLPLHIPVTTPFEDLNTLFLDVLRSNLPALASQIAQAMLQQPQVLARFLVLAGELASKNGDAKGFTQENAHESTQENAKGLTKESSKTSAIYSSTAVAAKLANRQLISRNVVDAVGLAEQALHLASNKPELPSLLRTVGAVIDGRLGMSNSLASPQIVRLRYLSHSEEKQTESAHLQLEWRADPATDLTANQSAKQSDKQAADKQPTQLSSTISGYQLTLKDSQGNALLRQPRYLSREMLSPTVNSAGEQVYTYQLPVNTESWPADVYFVELRSENHASGMNTNAASTSPNSKQDRTQTLTQERTHSQERTATVAIIKPNPPTCRAILSSVQTPNNTEYAKNDLRLSFSWQPFPGVKCYLLQSPSEDEVFALENCDFAAQWSQGEWQPVCQDVVFSQSRIAGRYTFQLARVSDGSFIDTAPSPIQTWQRLAMVNEIELEILLNPVGSKPTMSIWWDGNEGDTRFFPKVTMESATLEAGSSQQSDAAEIEFVPKASVEASQVLVEMRPLDDVTQWRVAIRTVSNMFSFSGDAGQIPSQFTPDIVLYPPHIMAQNGKTSGMSIEECAQQIRNVFTDISLVQLTDVLSKAGYEMENANLFGLAQTDKMLMLSNDYETNSH